MVAQLVKYRTSELTVPGWSPCLADFFPKIDNSYCNRIHASLTAEHCFHDGYDGRQPTA